MERKKHTFDLSPYPTKLIPFEPVNGPDTRYGQLHKPIAAHPFTEAGIKGFTSLSPFKVTAHFLKTDKDFAFHWPSLLELIDKIVPFPWSLEEEWRGNSSWVILSQLFRSCTQDHHPPPPPILILLFLH
jgi:hypothetical protein